MTLNETLKDWLVTFWKVLISPSPKTFVAEAQKANGKFASAMGWIIFFSIYIFIFSIIALKQVMVIGFIFVVLALPIAIIIFTSAMHFAYQRIFKRKQYLYDKLVYATVAILLPIQFLFVPLSTILFPVLSVSVNSILNYIIFLYQIVLLVIAFKSITNLKYWQSIATVLISIVVAGLVFLCTIPFLFSLLGGVNSTLR